MLLGLTLSLFSCRNEQDSLPDNNFHHNNNHDVVSFKTFRKETNILKAGEIFSESAAQNKKNQQSNPLSRFIVDTTHINRIIANNSLSTYAFRVYSLYGSAQDLYNMVYRKRSNGTVHYSILKITDTEVSLIYDSEKASLFQKKAYDSGSAKTPCTDYYAEFFHCKNGHSWDDCDKCADCVTTVHIVYGDCGGSGTGGNGPAYPQNPPANPPAEGNGGFYNLPDPSGYVFDPNETPTIDPQYVRAARAYLFWAQLDYNNQFFATEHPDIYQNLIENYLNNYSPGNNSNNSSFTQWALQFFVENPDTNWQQFQNWFINDQLNYQNSSDVEFAGNLSELSHDLLLANQNGTLDQLQANWPNWEKIKQKIKNSIAQGVHQTAKIVKTYYDEVSANPYYNNAATRVVLNIYIDALRNEIKQTTNMNKDTMNWQDLFNIWLFELMPTPYSSINFTWNSNVINGNILYNGNTNAVYTFPKGEPDMTNDIKSGLNSGGFNVGDSMTRYFHYNFTQYYATLSNQNIGIQILGSYPTKATVISKSGNSAVIRFYIFNTLGWDSATRFVKTKGPTIGIIPNKEIGEGLHLGGNLINTYTWEETIIY